MLFLILASQELAFYEPNINKISRKLPNCTDKKVMTNVIFMAVYVK